MKTSFGPKPLVFALAAVLLACVVSPAATAQALDQDGQAHSWKGPTGDFLVIDFAAEWCAPCWHSLPKFQALADQHPKLKFLVVSVDEQVSGRDRLVQDLKLRVPVLWDEGHAIAEHYQPEAMPSTYVIAPDGKVVYQHGGSNEEDWLALVEFVESLPADGGP